MTFSANIFYLDIGSIYCIKETKFSVLHTTGTVLRAGAARRYPTVIATARFDLCAATGVIWPSTTASSAWPTGCWR